MITHINGMTIDIRDVARVIITMVNEDGRAVDVVFTQDAFSQLQETIKGGALGYTIDEAFDRMESLSGWKL